MRFQLIPLPGRILTAACHPHRMSGKSWRRFLALIVACCIGLSQASATGIPVTDMFDGANGGLSTAADKSLRDVVYFANKAIIRVPAAKDIISFRINESSTLVLKSAFTAKVFFRLTYTDKDDVSTTEQNDRSLEINYDPAKTEPTNRTMI